MNKREQLMADVFGDGEGASFARAAAAQARRRRAIRQLVAGSAAAAAAVAILTALRQTPPPSLPPPDRPARGPTLEIISDEELLAQLKDQPVLFLRDQTGITGVVFLADATPPASRPSTGDGTPR